MNEDQAPVLFSEVQRFKQLWIWLIIYGTAALCWLGFIQQIILGKPFGTNPGPDWVMWLIWLLMGIAFPVFFHSISLTVKVREDHIEIRYRPMTTRRISAGEITDFEARSYKPVKEYGGWGIKGYSRKKMAYNISGREGVELGLLTGDRVMIGSNRPQELAAAIGAMLDHGR